MQVSTDLTMFYVPTDVSREIHLLGSSRFKHTPTGKEIVRKFVVSSINQPMRRPKAPIAITRIIFEDLHESIYDIKE